MIKELHPTLAETSALALRLHGADYHGHLTRVLSYLNELLASLPVGFVGEKAIEHGRHAALLHDSIEDGFITRDGLEALGYHGCVIALVEGLARDPSKQTYRDKINWIANSGDAVLVLTKLADNRDNSTPDRIASLPPEKRSLIKRYRVARRTLFDALARHLREFGASDEEISNIEQWLGNKDTATW